jgi:hypothetical protein
VTVVPDLGPEAIMCHVGVGAPLFEYTSSSHVVYEANDAFVSVIVNAGVVLPNASLVFVELVTPIYRIGVYPAVALSATKPAGVMSPLLTASAKLIENELGDEAAGKAIDAATPIYAARFTVEV